MTQTNDGPFLIVSRHDFRSLRKATMHFLTEELACRDTTRFFSFGLSHWSRVKGDPRLSLWNRSNKSEKVNGVDCYLWRTLLHPVNLRSHLLNELEFRFYVRLAPEIFRKWIAESKTIIFESGFPIIFIKMCMRINPEARLLYLASDGLKTLNCANFICSEFEELAASLDGLFLPSRQLKGEMPPNSPLFFIPRGFDKSVVEGDHRSPYSGGLNAVSVGSMLFDPSFIEIAALAFPEVTFHVIGGGVDADKLSGGNIKVYGEMSHLATVPFIKHANIGLAPYCGAKVSAYLADTSLKLMQYGLFGLPAVCPQIVAGAYTGRFGYDPGNAESIRTAVQQALDFGHFAPAPFLSWGEVADRMLDPQSYDDMDINETLPLAMKKLAA